MLKFEGCYLTNNGLAMVHKSGLSELTFTKAVAGAGVYVSKDEIATLTALKDQRQVFGLDACIMGEDLTAAIKFQISNNGLSAGYTLSEVGIYAKVDDGEEELYCVAYTLPENTEDIPAESEKIQYRMKITIQTVVSADAKVNLVYATDHEWEINYIKDMVGEVNVETDGTVMQQLEAVRRDKVSHDGDISETIAEFTESEQLESFTKKEKAAVILGKIAKAVNTLISHLKDKDNPHEVTKKQIGLEKVDNTSDKEKPVSDKVAKALEEKVSTTGDASNTTVTFTEAQQLSQLTTGAKMAETLGKIAKAVSTLSTHLSSTNPHNITKTDIGLENVDNTADKDKPVSTLIQKALDNLYKQLIAYADKKVADLIDGAPETMDTLNEVAAAIAEHKSVEEALNAAIGKKASQTEVDFCTEKIGTNDISDIADGTLTGAAVEHKKKIDELNSNLDGISAYFNNNRVVLNGSDHIDLETPQGKVQIACNSEGGNVRLTKITSDGLDPHIEIDTCAMNGSNGYARLYIGNSKNEAYTVFSFCEDGSFQDGRGNNTGGLAAGVTNVTNTVNALASTVSNHKQAYTASELDTYTADKNTMGVTPAAVKKAINGRFSLSGTTLYINTL